MKRIIAFFLVLLLIIPVACAEISLEGMTFDELVALKDRINLAIWESDEWQEVIVPPGMWQVGVDIPAGHWTVKCAPDWKYTHVAWGQGVSDNGNDLDFSNGRSDASGLIFNPDHKNYKVGDGITEYSFEVRDGEYIQIAQGNCVFMPYTGKPDLGFK